VAAFSGSHRYVLDSLAAEVLERQSEQVRSLPAGNLAAGTPEWRLCDAVTGRAGGQAMLERVERANLFLVPLDEVRGWWRYHHLFAGPPCARQQQPGRVVALHRAAAAWHEEHGLADDAVRHALAAWAARLMKRHVDAFLLRSEGARPCSGGLRRSRPGWPGPGRGCCSRGRSWPCSATAWARPRACWTRPSAPPSG